MAKRQSTQQQQYYIDLAYEKSQRAKYYAIGTGFLLLILAIVIVWACGSQGFVQNNPLKFFNSWGTATSDPNTWIDIPDITYKDPNVEYGKYGYLVVMTDDEENSPVALTATTRNVNGQLSEVLTATVTPANATILNVWWTSSDEEYVVVTPLEGDFFTCKITCIRAFDQPVTVTCNVVSTEQLTATCEVGCLAQPNDDVEATLGSSTLSFGETYTASVMPGMMIGTVKGEFVVTGWEINLLPEIVNEITAELGIDPGWDYGFGPNSATGTLLTPRDCFADSDIDNVAFLNAFVKACHDKDECATVEIMIKYIYNGETYASYSRTENINFDPDSYFIPAENITINPNKPVLGS